MRSRLFVLASGLAVLLATPSLALTVSSAPPNRDVAPHLAPQPGSAGPAFRDTWAGGGRPQTGASFSSGSVTYGTSTSGFGSVRTIVQPAPRDSWTTDQRRASENPLALSPPRR